MKPLLLLDVDGPLHPWAADLLRVEVELGTTEEPTDVVPLREDTA